MSRQELLETWRATIKSIPLEDLPARQSLLNEMLAAFTGNRSEDEEEAINECAEEVEDAIDYWQRGLQDECPIAFFRPSLEQAMVINAWAPWAKEAFENVDASRVPDWMDYEGGYRSVCNFSCNRGAGKTCSSIIDTILWVVPNDPAWKMFEWMEDRDSSGKLLSNARYRILPRPDWELWNKRGRVRYNGLSAPPKGVCDIWHGVGRSSDWTQKVWLEYKRWLPKESIGIRDDGGKAVFKLEQRFQTKWGHNIIGMSMSAEDDAWAGKACWRLNVDEGIPQGLFREGMTRIMDGGYYHHAYTPVDPANIGEKAAVAKKIYQCAPGFELVGKAKFFTKFRIQDSSFLPPGQIADNVKRWKGMGAEGESRMHGGFYDSSPLVFTNFRREFHILPWNTTDVVQAINGKGDPELVRIFEKANIVRGFDEGIAHPSACVWVAILRTGENVFFREWQKSGISISERVEAIIDLSGNKRVEVNYRRKLTEHEQDVADYASQFKMDVKRSQDTGIKLLRYREEYVRENVRKTFADPKMFKRDPNFPMEDWSENYIRAGLRIERSMAVGPAARCDYLNELMRPDPTRKHLTGAADTGCRAYVLRDCPILIERFENYLQDQQRDGTFSGKPVDVEDDMIDAACYSVVDKLKWIDPAILEARRNQKKAA